MSRMSKASLFTRCFFNLPNKIKKSVQYKQDTILIWDIENVRLPNNVNPEKVIKVLKQAFMDPTMTRPRKTVTCLTQKSLKAIQFTHPDFIDNVIDHMDVSMASSSNHSKNADYVLCREFQSFIDTYPRGSKIVLLSGDADFLEPVQRAIKLGFHVQLVYVDKKISHTLLELKYNKGHEPIEWTLFLKDALKMESLSFPYPLNELMHQMHQMQPLALDRPAMSWSKKNANNTWPLKN